MSPYNSPCLVLSGNSISQHCARTSADRPSLPLSLDLHLILPKTTQQLCPKIKVSLFRFYFLKALFSLPEGFVKPLVKLLEDSKDFKLPISWNWKFSRQKSPDVQITDRDHMLQPPCLSGLRLSLAFIDV